MPKTGQRPVGKSEKTCRTHDKPMSLVVNACRLSQTHVTCRKRMSLVEFPHRQLGVRAGQFRPMEEQMDEQKPETPDIATLARTYPDPSRGIGLLVLREFRNIQRARARGWRWPEVAASLGYPGQGRSIATAFSRVKKRVEAKTLEPPDPAPKTAGKRPGSSGKSQARPAGAAREIDPDSGFRTPAPSTVDDTNDNDPKWM